MKLWFPSILVAALAVACTPDPLAGFGDASVDNNSGTDMGPGPGPNNGTNGTNNGGPNNGGMTVTAEFQQVADIMIPNCLAAGCHGPQPMGVFAVPTGVNATPAELAAALQVQTPTADGPRLVTPNDPAMSDISIRITETDPIRRMPAAGLPMTDITTIETWISNGAVYFQ